MAHTNATTHYSLPQFLSTDKPAWLTDVNPAYEAIDTAIYNAKDAADDAQADATQALSDAGTAKTTADAADAKGSGAVASIADAFDTTATYDLGDHTVYNSLLYVCTTPVTTPGPWTGSANWTRTTLEDIIDGVASSIDGKADASTVYTKTEADTLLAAKLDSSYHVSTANGTFGGLVGDNQIWLIAVQRLTTTNTCVVIASRYGTTVFVKEIVKDSGFAYVTNAQGTISFTFNNSSTGVAGGAYKLA